MDDREAERVAVQWLDSVGRMWEQAAFGIAFVALQKYGRHLASCQRYVFTHDKFPCTCGFSSYERLIKESTDARD